METFLAYSMGDIRTDIVEQERLGYKAKLNMKKSASCSVTTITIKIIYIFIYLSAELNSQWPVT
jgi:hypothetical protein